MRMRLRQRQWQWEGSRSRWTPCLRPPPAPGWPEPPRPHRRDGRVPSWWLAPVPSLARRTSPRSFPRFQVNNETGRDQPIRNRTATIARSPDRTASRVTGDMALSVSPLLVQDSFIEIYTRLARLAGAIIQLNLMLAVCRTRMAVLRVHTSTTKTSLYIYNKMMKTLQTLKKKKSARAHTRCLLN
jgi:hypothetical protein